MIRIKSVVISVFIILSFVKINAQQDPQYTQYMYNTLSVNPAYAGSNDHTIINILARTQWVGVDGAPQTQTLSYDTPLGYSGVGLGINLINDKIGPSNELFLDANVSYTIRTSNRGNLSFGLKLGGRYLNVDWSKTNPQSGSDIELRNNITKFLPTIGAGVFYYKPNWYLGLAIPNFLRTDHYDDNVNGGDVATERMHYFLIGGYVFNLTDDIKFKPAFLTKIVDGAPLSLDVSANFLFNDKFRLGVAWRWGDSISALLGLQVSRSMQIGYAYDLTTSNYSNYNSGSHEIMLRFEIFKQKVMKSPRFF
ncbi:type IX secretion system membrane protein PorP/SprF [Tenacibaculum sp. IB213877]|uniref:PorP/SprF family type IX secretion system membrane protein n=1 Tax=Tenacibaculum sp. IB213877 TaxID=3097351 RepID=UPI002A59DFE4|nr:type IX secretion system membrane protein PorP/SprF [Tenacibaculum sp. IB213877]MDY0781013.1 type IX secretion system membrane protein PorP/SprF [Tenacibaculum sp. IB213877]